MTGQDLQTRDELGGAYLEHLQDLASEINHAIEAIASNSLPKLQESVAKQETLCSQLLATAQNVSEYDRSSGDLLLARTDSAIDEKIRATSKAIQ